MDEKGDYITIETPNKSHDYNYPRKTFEFLLSICIISFFLFYFSGLPYFSFHELQVFDRKCMFLICNGILAFLAKNLSYEEKHAASMEYDDTPLDNIAIPQEKHMSLVQQEDEDYEAEKKESVIVILESDEEEEEEEEEDQSVDVMELEVSTEELNKKFEEFIRRMKEEIRIDNI